MQTCLVVDDDGAARRRSKRLLVELGYLPVPVAGGEAAGAAVQQRPYDAALVHVTMPVFPGLQVIREMMMVAPSTRILAVDENDAEEAILAALDAGASGFLTRDELVEQLGRALHDVLAGKTALSPRARNSVQMHVADRLRVLRVFDARRRYAREPEWPKHSQQTFPVLLPNAPMPAHGSPAAHDPETCPECRARKPAGSRGSPRR